MYRRLGCSDGLRWQAPGLWACPRPTRALAESLPMEAQDSRRCGSGATLLNAERHLPGSESGYQIPSRTYCPPLSATQGLPERAIHPVPATGLPEVLSRLVGPSASSLQTPCRSGEEHTDW